MAESGNIQEEINEIRQFVREYKPGDAVEAAVSVQFPQRLFIGLFGRTGCGKTSLINSLKFAVEGNLRRAKWLQVGGQEKTGGHTKLRKQAGLTKNVFVIDNRGMDKPHITEALEELDAQLDGRRGYTEVVQWEGEKTNVDEIDSLGDKIACAVFVFSASHDLAVNIAGLEQVVSFLHSKQGRYPVAVITHVDATEKKDVERLQVALRMSGISDIFAVANVTVEKTKLEKEYQLNMLNLLDRCMTEGDESIIYQHLQGIEAARVQQAGRQREEARKREENAEQLRRRQKQLQEEQEIERRVQSLYRSLQEEKEREIREIMERNRAAESQSSCTIL